MLALAGRETSRIELGHRGRTELIRAHPQRFGAASSHRQRAVRRPSGCLALAPPMRPGIEALGLAYDRPALHMREYVEILKALGDAGRVDYEGRMYRVRTGFGCPGRPAVPRGDLGLGTVDAEGRRRGC